MKISVIGCGWLGLPLAKVLLSKGHQVLGSTTSADRLQLLEDSGIEPSLFSLNPMPQGTDFNRLFESELIVINIPPKSKSRSPEYYREQIKYLKYLLGQSSAKRVIFISSTSYYPNTNLEMNEDSPFDLSMGSNQAVVWGEQEISQIDQDLIILRCGGLMGSDRIPGRWFSGKSIKGISTKVNYVHQSDVIGEILQLIQSNKWPRIKNLVNPKHLTKGEVYSAMALKYGFEPPQWIDPKLTDSKIVLSKFPETIYKDLLDY